jgi:uncharacterized membrane protein YbhN (UPF0104 family)
VAFEGGVTGARVVLPHLKRALRLAPLALLALVLWREKPWAVPMAEGARWAVAAAILLNLMVSLPVKAARWRVALTDPPPFPAVLAATLEGLLASAAIGFGSGDVVRSARLRERAGRMALDYACAWAERGAEVLALAVLVLVGALVTDLGTWAVVSALTAVAVYAAVIAAGHRFVPRLARWPRVQHAFSAGLQASTPRRVAAMVALSLLGWSCEVAMLVLFQGAFGLQASFGMALLTLVGINVAIAIPAAPGHFGTYEAGAAAALVLCGAPRDVAVSYAVSFHLSHVVPVAAVATAVYLYRSSRRYRTTPARTST